MVCSNLPVWITTIEQPAKKIDGSQRFRKNGGGQLTQNPCSQGTAVTLYCLQHYVGVALVEFSIVRRILTGHRKLVIFQSQAVTATKTMQTKSTCHFTLFHTLPALTPRKDPTNLIHFGAWVMMGGEPSFHRHHVEVLYSPHQYARFGPGTGPCRFLCVLFAQMGSQAWEKPASLQVKTHLLEIKFPWVVLRWSRSPLKCAKVCQINRWYSETLEICWRLLPEVWPSVYMCVCVCVCACVYA